MSNYPGCEEETAAFGIQYNKIAEGDELEPFNRHLLEDNTYQQVQYTTMAYCLGKMFEIEVSRSIVQMMRNSMGVEMPRYFCIYKKGNTCIIPGQNNNQDVNLNRGFNNQWQAPALGQSLYAYKYLQQNPRNNFEDWGNQFVDLWGRMKDWRNSAGHTGLIDINGITTAQQTFLQLQKNYFARMMQMKIDFNK